MLECLKVLKYTGTKISYKRNSLSSVNSGKSVKHVSVLALVFCDLCTFR